MSQEEPFGSLKPSLLARGFWRLAAWNTLSSQFRKRLRKGFGAMFCGPYDITAEDLNFRVFPNENYCDRILIGRERLPERDEHQLIDQCLCDGDVFIDIGANVGTYSIFGAKRVGASGHVLALEPNPATAERLRYNLDINDCSNVSLFDVAIGPDENEMPLWINQGGNAGQTSLLADGAGRAPTEVTVRVRPLLSLIEEARIDTISLLKIDVEGFEDQALVPFLEEAPDRLMPRHILIEDVRSDLWETDCFAALTQRGYERMARTDENSLLSLVDRKSD